MRLTDGRLVGGRDVPDPQRVVGQQVGHPDPQGAREAHVPVRAHVLERQAGCPLEVHHLGVPHRAVEAGRPAVQRVRPVVDRHLDLDPVEQEAAGGEAVGVPADDGAEVGRAVEVAGEVGVAERDLGDPAVPVGQLDGLHRGAVRQDPHPRPAPGRERPAVHLPPAHGAERLRTGDLTAWLRHGGESPAGRCGAGRTVPGWRSTTQGRHPTTGAWATSSPTCSPTRSAVLLRPRPGPRPGREGLVGAAVR